MLGNPTCRESFDPLPLTARPTRRTSQSRLGSTALARETPEVILHRAGQSRRSRLTSKVGLHNCDDASKQEGIATGRRRSDAVAHREPCRSRSRPWWRFVSHSLRRLQIRASPVRDNAPRNRHRLHIYGMARRAGVRNHSNCVLGAMSFHCTTFASLHSQACGCSCHACRSTAIHGYPRCGEPLLARSAE